MKSLLIEFLGCKVNSYEVEAVAKTFLDNGYHFFDEETETSPDVIIVNTCAVTQTSIVKDKKVIKKYRKAYANAVIVVMGCYAQYKAEYIKDTLGADIVLGTSNRMKTFDLVDDFLHNHKKITLHEESNDIRTYESMQIDKSYLTTRAYVKIQDGCNNFCSYCLIPYVRGRSRSRKKEEIVLEINNLVNNGHKEVVLTGVDMSSYGLDLSDKTTFSDLLEYILDNCGGLQSLRISSLEESLLDEKFLFLLKTRPTLSNHLHIPLQSGSESVVKRMNRKYNLTEFKNKVKLIRSIREDIAITTDVIVGFPGETEDNFNETYKSCEEINFSKIHVFPYSDREGTVASKMKDKIDPQIKKERVHKLLELSTKLEEEYCNKFYGQTINFLIEEYDDKLKAYKGHSSNYLHAFVSSDKDIRNTVVPIKYSKENKLDF